MQRKRNKEIPGTENSSYACVAPANSELLFWTVCARSGMRLATNCAKTLSEPLIGPDIPQFVHSVLHPHFLRRKFHDRPWLQGKRRSRSRLLWVLEAKSNLVPGSVSGVCRRATSWFLVQSRHSSRTNRKDGIQARCRGIHKCTRAPARAFFHRSSPFYLKNLDPISWRTTAISWDRLAGV